MVAEIPAEAVWLPAEPASAFIKPINFQLFRCGLAMEVLYHAPKQKQPRIARKIGFFEIRADSAWKTFP